ncbi:HEAT repeat domain-containing protein, partial [Candidatus Poribacteria bacterium]|nr:HEAT repeat domain-containing protein [Candidatus Poribacteria bacterium]
MHPGGTISEEEVAGFIEQLKAEDAALRLQAAQALAEAAEEGENRSALLKAVKPLIVVLKDADAAVRAAAALALGEIKDARAVLPLSAALEDKAAEVRFNAAYTLGEIG